MEDAVPKALRDLLREKGRIGLAFSGGTDSTYLMYAMRECGIDFIPYIVRSRFQTASETEDAVRLAEDLGISPVIIDADVLSDGSVASNPPDRCYRCKRLIFGSIIECASKDGIDLIADGTNASDDPSGRPGMRALEELNILSPLRVCGITKPQVRELSRIAGLPTWDRPSNSCLATRIPSGMPITESSLARTECSEEEIRELGFSGIRVRTTAEGCRFEFTESQRELFDSKKSDVEQILLKYYPSVSYSVREPGL